MAGAAVIELDDVQGLVVRGYGGLAAARYLVGAIEKPVAARAWLAGLAERLDTGRGRPDTRAVNVAFTAPGLARLGLPGEVLATFSEPFASGMAAPFRSRALGDVGASAPEHWAWGGPGDQVDLLLLLYARDDAELAALQADVLEGAAGGIRIVRALNTAPLTDREPFGFRDGISQPRIAELGGNKPERDSIRAGEFVLGYANEYGRLTDGPPGDLGRNGSYLVVRQLAQDVDGFWAWCEKADSEAPTRLAAKLVGRWPSGAPLVLARDGDRPELGNANDFGYHAEDAAGLRCPIGAHVRRANPRDSLDPEPGSRRSVDVGKRHRLLRRGRAYGGPEDAEQGLHFICLAANVARQFEFVQQTWLNSPRFAGLYDSPDPLTRGGTFAVPARPVRTRYTGIPQFVTVRGGAYLFLPGLRGIRALVSL